MRFGYSLRDVNHHTEKMQNFWEARYAEAPYAYGTAPNEFLVAQLQHLPAKGKILLPMDGEGRNAVYAAQQGWEVTAFDYAAAAVKKAENLAREKGVALNFVQADAGQFDYGTAQYDAIALVFAHLPLPLRTHMHQACVQALKPGGTLILEGFHHNQLNHPSGGPKQIELLFTPTIIAQDFDGLQTVLLEDRETQLSEGLYHVGSAHVVRFVGKKN